MATEGECVAPIVNTAQNQTQAPSVTLRVPPPSRREAYFVIIKHQQIL